MVRTHLVQDRDCHYYRADNYRVLWTGLDFSTCKIVQTCLNMAGGASKCKARQAANGNVGPSYPQGVSVVHPAPASMQGLYVVATNNKEDVVITRVPWAALLDELA